MNKIELTLARTALAAAAALSLHAVAQAGEVEVLHYWTSGGEAKSAAALKGMMDGPARTAPSSFIFH